MCTPLKVTLKFSIFWYPPGTYDRTPRGEFGIWVKLRHTRMSGGSDVLGTVYDLPNVPYVMYFYNADYFREQGYGLHGTYWHDNFGTPMSHGCINLRTEDAQKLYEWADPVLESGTSVRATEENPGTRVVIYGVPPA